MENKEALKIFSLLTEELSEFKKFSVDGSKFVSVTISTKNRTTKLVQDGHGIHVYKEEHFEF